MDRMIHDNGAGLSDADGQALAARGMKQEDVITAFFAARPGRYYTPWEVYHALDEQYMIGSVRRAMTNLEHAGTLMKCTDRKKPGDGGVDCCTWTANVGQGRLF